LRRHRQTKSPLEFYPKFDQLNGDHPWMKLIPGGYVSYRVRELGTGKVAYFNFHLAQEMGLVSPQQPHVMNEQLEKKLLSTFSLQIINEFDELNAKRIDTKAIKPNKYMASRYLQLQHSNRQGKTSGDGRGIWNGVVEHQGTKWDVSSRGTGVTCLSPGAVEANRPLRTGEGTFGYGCGQAEIDELYAAAIQAEIMYLQGINTERVLCIIDLGKGYGIGVRAGKNLLRPAHLFLYLKQNRFTELKTSVDYFIDRQTKNGRWKPKQKSSGKYDEWIEHISSSYAQFAAILDMEYIFAWLDWDGDNVLADAGIIDYGSVRQFGLRHDQYRYDDVERFSTNLTEQRLKARYTVQVFAQIADFLKTGSKKPLKSFAKHPSVLQFNESFKKFRAHRLLYRMGFNALQRENILRHPRLFEDFDRVFSYFEKAKISGKVEKVSDGINHPALFNMRVILRELPLFYLKNGFDSNDMNFKQFYNLILSSFAKQRDTKVRAKHVRHIVNFQRLYKELVKQASGRQQPNLIIRGICERAKILNREDRITGNALIQIVNEILVNVKKGLPYSEVQALIDQLIHKSLGLPEVKVSRFYEQKPRLLVRPDIYQKLLNLVEDYCEDI
jgi:hypothetical protein